MDKTAIVIATIIIVISIMVSHTAEGLSLFSSSKRPKRLLRCYVCENCNDQELGPSYIRLCPEDSSESCMKSIAKFAHYTTISRSCSQAPPVSPQSCLSHTINIMRTQICLCETSLCNGAENLTWPKPNDDFDVFMGINQASLNKAYGVTMIFIIPILALEYRVNCLN